MWSKPGGQSALKREAVEKVSESFSSFLSNAQKLRWTGAAGLSSVSRGLSRHPSLRRIGQSVSCLARNLENVKTSGVDAISTSVSAVSEEYHNLCRNLERNVRTLTSRGEEITDMPTKVTPYLRPSSTNSSLTISQSNDRSDDVSRSSKVPSSASSETNSNGEVSEDDPRPDHTTVSATSPFSIGFVGPPLLVLEADDDGVVSMPNSNSPGRILGSIDVPEPSLRLMEVRRGIGELLLAYKFITTLGLKEGSWVHKMPWHNPPPPTLARGLQRPRQKFSSVKERREYHKRARRRASYVFNGRLPGWSWFAADVIFLYCLIYNPAGKYFPGIQ